MAVDLPQLATITELPAGPMELLRETFQVCAERHCCVRNIISSDEFMCERGFLARSFACDEMYLLVSEEALLFISEELQFLGLLRCVESDNHWCVERDPRNRAITDLVVFIKLFGQIFHVWCADKRVTVKLRDSM